MLILLSVACTYTAEAYWKDLAEAHCKCEREEEAWRDCRKEWMAVYEGQPYYEACYDDPAPVERSEVRDWVRETTENCRSTDEELPEPADPFWFEDCQG